MAFLTSAEVPAYVVGADSWSTSMIVRQGMSADAGVNAGTLDEIHVAGCRYPLRHKLRSTYLPDGQYIVEGLSPPFIGCGATAEKAAQEWKKSVHLAIQTLLSKRPFEMTKHEKHQWAAILDHIDVTVYRNNTPVSVRQYGSVYSVGIGPDEVKWDDGLREHVSLDRVYDSDFVTYRKGQAFEAIVERDPVTFGLIRILHIERRATPKRPKPAEESKLIESFGTTRTLEKSSWE